MIKEYKINFLNLNDSNTIIKNILNKTIKSLPRDLFSEKVKIVPAFMFHDCRNLVNVELSNHTERIGWSAFYYCISLSNVIFSSTLKSIGYEAFRLCVSLKNIELPNTLETIGESAFSGCSSLTSITYKGTIEEWNAIEKGYSWNYSVPAEYVQCTDGQVLI